MKLPLGILLALSFCAPLQTRLQAGGEEVVVIYNSRSSESKALAEYYARVRDVPKTQVWGFSLPPTEEMSRAQFRDDFQKPLAKKLESSKLWRLGNRPTTGADGQPTTLPDFVVESRIRYLVLCHGVPLKIVRDGSLKEPEEDRMRPELRRNEAAVDSELTCLPLLQRKMLLAGPAHNPVYGTTNAAAINPTNGVLIVARLDGPTPQIARSLVDQALAAEKDGLWGRAYIDLRNTTDPGLKQGDDWIRTAGEACKQAGFETVVEPYGGLFPVGFPMSQIGFYAGWYSENVIGPFAAPHVEFMPGAFAYHLHSFSASSLRVTNHNWSGPLLAKGVTATMGTVDEPYLGGTPDIGVFASRWLLFKMTFGEAACASQNAISWQTTVVGDPLYRACAKPARQLHQELEAQNSKLLEWSHLRVVNLSLARMGALAESVGYLEEIPTTKTSAVLSEKLGDLYATQGKPTSAAAAYEQALKFVTSPLQRLRVRLRLGEKLTETNQDEAAFANYEALLSENPGYPDKVDFYRKLAALAQKLGRKEVASRYETLAKESAPKGNGQ